MCKKIVSVMLLLCFALIAGCGEADNTNSQNSSINSDNGSVSVTVSEETNTSNGGTTSTPDASNSSSSTTQNTSSEATSSNSSDSTSSQTDPNAPTVYLTAQKQGKTVTLSLNAKNNPGVAAYVLKVTYDKEKLKPTAINGVLTKITSNLQQPNANPNGKITAVYVNIKGTDTDGEFFNITFDVIDGAKGTAKFEIIADDDDFVAADSTVVKFAKQNLEITLD